MIVLAKPRKLRMNADDFYEFVNKPENRTRSFELVRGEVIEVSRPRRSHGFIYGNVARILGNYTFRKKKGYVTSNDSGVVLEHDPDTVRGPDVAYYEDVEAFEDLPEKWGDIAPRLAVEVLSPNDTAHLIIDKITDYLNNGVEVVWVIDPDNKRVTIYSKTAGVQMLTEKDALPGGDVLPGFRCKMADLFLLPDTTRRPAKKRKR